MAGIYIHIPFCRQACSYCNFHFSTSLRQKDELLQALLQEISMQRHWLRDVPVETIYFGGGTPSLLQADELLRIFDALYSNFQIGKLKEITLEANPDDLSLAYLRALKRTPVGRLSVGIQSFREEDLRYMNRAHTAQQSEYALKAAQDTGFDNLSIDLIYGTPGMDDAAWLQNIQTMATLQIPHFSAYALTVEERTALHHAISKKAAPAVDAAQSAAQAELLMDEVPRLGYEQYEISNFSRPGCHALHNTSYWMGVPYLGLGPAAHSFDGQKLRKWNVANNSRYIRSILEEEKIPFEQEELTPMQRLNEYIMTSLRTKWGCNLSKVEAGWGSDIRRKLLNNAEGFLSVHQMLHQEDKLILTHKGKLFADGIAAELFFSENLV
ncbi:MAG: radical SAM family heme chaperone HemW [Bacteroidetes bacterium]|nr:radical SAM family heme chaperone HemW [Bacteroidota bacterium]MBS1629395.1 radical SAM family heme chaperone HemW [Bacteroidota bacterium]